MKPSAFGILFLLVVQHSSSALNSISGRVTKIIDGDTFVVTSLVKNFVVRPVDMDAPEKGQPYSGKSRAVLGDMVMGKKFTLISSATATDGALLAEIPLSATKSVTAEMIRLGLAWCVRDGTRTLALESLESAARQSGVGLWSVKTNQVAPWEYRNGVRPALKPSPTRPPTNQEVITDFAPVPNEEIVIGEPVTHGYIGIFKGRGTSSSDLIPLPAGLNVFSLEHWGHGYFSVELMDSNGDLVNLLANTIGPHSATKSIKIPSDGKYLIQVEADQNAPWKVMVK
jgi:micrococcal nuclease